MPVLVVGRADNRHQEPDGEAEHDGGEGDLECDAEAA